MKESKLESRLLLRLPLSLNRQGEYLQFDQNGAVCHDESNSGVFSDNSCSILTIVIISKYKLVPLIYESNPFTSM